jgi:hypothetical protein
VSRPGRIFAALCAVSVVALAGYIYFSRMRASGLSEAEAPAVADATPPQTSGNAPAASEPAPETSAPAAPNESGPSNPAAQPAAAINSGAEAGASATASTAPPQAAPTAAAAISTPAPSARIFFRYNGSDSNYGRLAVVRSESARPGKPTIVSDLSCEVVHVAGGYGSCLTAKRGVLTTYSAKLFDAGSFKVLATLPLPGIPSRTRVSPDGTLAAFTVFVSGHGYESLDFSTQTNLVETHTGKVLANLEEFAVTSNGQPIKNADFNFWGVTFTHDSKHFFATLSTAGRHHLISGDLATRSAKIIHDDVECPSLSPDNTRIAYKKRFDASGRVAWQLQVLDLASGKETKLAEKRSVDDQLDWLDDTHVLYSLPVGQADTAASTEVWIADVTGKADPKMFLRTAYSPSTVR